jgi:hypothetical protein
MADVHTESAVAAALDVTERFGVPTDPFFLLHTRSNVLVRLGALVARVPATTRLMRTDPAPWLARDVELSRFLTERGVPVVSPSADPPAGPHFSGGLPVTLWHYTRHDPDHRYSPAEIAKSLGRVHEALREYPGELPRRGPLDDIDRIFTRHGEAIGDALPRLRSEAARIEAALPTGPVQALHGDAHPGNVIATPDGPCWLDFEDTWRGPLAWDVATLVKQSDPSALDAYPGEVDESAFGPFLELRRLLGTLWQFVVAERFPERLEKAHKAVDRYA